MSQTVATTKLIPKGSQNASPFAGALAGRKILGGYVVCDANGQALAYVYGRATTEARATQAKVLTEDEAHLIAASIAQLPQLLGYGR